MPGGRRPRSHARRGARPAGQADGRTVRRLRAGVHLRARCTTCGPVPALPPSCARRALDLAAARGPRQVAVHPAAAGGPATRAWLAPTVSWRTATRRSSRTPGSGCACRWPPTPGTRRSCCATRALGEALRPRCPCCGHARRGAGTRITVDKLAEGRAPPAAVGRAHARPDRLGWPHLIWCCTHGWQPVIHYPVGPPSCRRPPRLEHADRRGWRRWPTPSGCGCACCLAREPVHHGRAGRGARHDRAGGIPAPRRPEEGGLLTTRRRGRYVLHQLDVTAVARLGSDFLEGRHR